MDEPCGRDSSSEPMARTAKLLDGQDFGKAGGTMSTCFVQTKKTLTKGRTILIGDAGGFVSGSTGEGIYPGMVSGAIAADVVHDALKRGTADVSTFNDRWRLELGSYLRSLAGGEQKQATV